MNLSRASASRQSNVQGEEKHQTAAPQIRGATRQLADLVNSKTLFLDVSTMMHFK